LKEQSARLLKPPGFVSHQHNIIPLSFPLRTATGTRRGYSVYLWLKIITAKQKDQSAERMTSCE
jgi:hypothetical protein